MVFRDPVSSASHLFTAVWAIFATLILLRLTGPDRRRRAAVLVYGLSMVFLYLASGVFHAKYYEDPAERRFYQMLDQTAILGLIAGTCTPPIVMLLKGPLQRWFLAIMWGLAAIAATCLWLLPQPPHAVIVGICLGMGWFSAVPLFWYYQAVGWRAMNYVLLGAASYSIGSVFELAEWPNPWPGWIGFHEVFHFCDILGSVAFFLFITRYVIPYQPPELPVRGAQPAIVTV